MRISVFLSSPKPHRQQQAQFIEKINQHLLDRGFSPRTLGVTDYDMDAPLKAIRRLMLESNGLITIAFRRTLVEKGEVRAGAALDDSPRRRFPRCGGRARIAKSSRRWLTNWACRPWSSDLRR